VELNIIHPMRLRLVPRPLSCPENENGNGEKRRKEKKGNRMRKRDKWDLTLLPLRKVGTTPKHKNERKKEKKDPAL
jgi:hypothetical protein